MRYRSHPVVQFAVTTTILVNIALHKTGAALMILFWVTLFLQIIPGIWAFRVAFTSKHELKNISKLEQTYLVNNSMIILFPALETMKAQPIAPFKVFASDLVVNLSDSQILTILSVVIGASVDPSAQMLVAAETSWQNLVLDYLETLTLLFKNTVIRTIPHVLVDFGTSSKFASPDQLFIFGKALWNDIGNMGTSKFEIAQWLLGFASFISSGQYPSRHLFTTSKMSLLLSIYLGNQIEADAVLPLEMKRLAALLGLATVSTFKLDSSSVLHGLDHEKIISQHPELPTFLQNVLLSSRILNCSEGFFEMLQTAGLNSPSLFFHNYKLAILTNRLEIVEADLLEFIRILFKSKYSGKLSSEELFQTVLAWPDWNWGLLLKPAPLNPTWIKPILLNLLPAHSQNVAPEVVNSLLYRIIKLDEKAKFKNILNETQFLIHASPTHVGKILTILRDKRWPCDDIHVINTLFARPDYESIFNIILSYDRLHEFLDANINHLSTLTLIRLYNLYSQWKLAEGLTKILDILSTRPSHELLDFQVVYLINFYLTTFPIDLVLTRVEKLAELIVLHQLLKGFTIFNDTDPQNVLTNLVPSILFDRNSLTIEVTGPIYSDSLLLVLTSLFQPLIPKVWNAFIQDCNTEFPIRTLSKVFLYIRPVVTHKDFKSIYNQAQNNPEIINEKDVTLLLPFLKIYDDDAGDWNSFVTHLTGKLPLEQWQREFLLYISNFGSKWELWFKSEFERLSSLVADQDLVNNWTTGISGKPT